MKEIWRDVIGYEGLYKVSNLGNVLSIPRKGTHSNKEYLLKQSLTKKGYLYVILSKKCKSFDTGVHRLVAQAFIPNLENKSQVNHKNGIKTDNRVENLEWVTNEENMRHSWEIGLRNKEKSYKYGKDNVLSVKVNQYSLDGIFIKTWFCIKDVERQLKFDNRNICACCRHKRNTAYGYIWRYIDDYTGLKHNSEV